MAAREREALLASLPIPAEALRGLFDCLDEQFDGCDDSLKLTCAHLEERGYSPDRVIPWLESHGGYCDCEVLANVEENVRAARSAATRIRS